MKEINKDPISERATDTTIMTLAMTLMFMESLSS